MLENLKTISRQYGPLPYFVVMLLISTVSDISIQVASIIVSKFDNFLLFIWNIVGHFIGVDIGAYRRELTFCSLILAMVLSNYKKIERLELVKSDRNVMQWLNFFAMLSIQSLLSNKNQDFSLFALYILWSSFFVCLFMMYTIYLNDEFRLLVKLYLLLTCLIVVSQSMVYVNNNSLTLNSVDYFLAPIIVFTSLFILVFKISNGYEFIFIISLYFIFIFINFADANLPLFGEFLEVQR